MDEDERKAKLKAARKKAYQAAKQKKKDYLEKQRQDPEYQARLARQKAAAREERRRLYQEAKARRQKEAADREPTKQRPLDLDPGRLKLVRYDQESGAFEPVQRTPPSLRLVQAEDPPYGTDESS